MEEGWIFVLKNWLPGEKSYGVELSHQEWQTWSSQAVPGTFDEIL